ncbi:villin headpiece, Villin/Gelsolin, ADF-H/Gelsolin-like domain protein [Artemisia annua]|uniref:Villin headpiece, Villin/Gelsolin, ADF-H/Gelsolin-like domain protein n=1 Tax=Artemisia annua TaxID=35608 RepID=A0A2U1Q1G5_ARTAN|nr:villin headpiece, Villin/Gelsolin, ADF-H/Gelsolin-like domain protein [Artemisia annua]
MSVSMRDLDPAFQGAGQKEGIEVWRIENFAPVPVPQSSYGKFFTGDSYVILKTNVLKSGALRHDIHYWIGKDTSQDEAGTAAIKTIELDATLGGRAVQYREVQGHETERFLSYFKPCIIPQAGGVASGFTHAEAEEHKIRMFICQGKHVVHVPYARSSLNHDDIFILDTANKIFQFNGSNSCIQERAKALEVVQHIKDTYHDGKCEIASIEDGRMMSDAETGEFWSFFGGFAPLPRKAATDDVLSTKELPTKLFCVKKGQAEPVDADPLTRELLDTYKCYILDCGQEIYVWLGRNTSLEGRKAASGATEEYVRSQDRRKSHIIRVIENFETVTFRSKFDSWPQSTAAAVSEEGRGKVAALLKRQGIDVNGLLKAAPTKEDPQPYIDCTGNLQVWRVNGQEKILLPLSDQSKFYTGDCYIYQYLYPGEDQEECLIGTWFGNQSIEEDRISATSQAYKMVEAQKFLAAQSRVYEGSEPTLFFAIFQSFMVLKGGLSDGYKNAMSEKELPDGTCTDEEVALFRVQGSGPENMQAIQLEPVASSLNSSYCYILHSGSSVFTWIGNLAAPEDQELVERQLDVIKPNMQSKQQKEGSESEQFWKLLGGKSEYPSQKTTKATESDPHLFSCTFSKGQQVDSKIRTQALAIGEKFVQCDFLLEKLSHRAPCYIIMEASEPQFFTRFFTWDSSKSAINGNSFERKLSILKNGGRPTSNSKPKRRAPVSNGGRSAAVEKPQRSRSVTFSPERVRVRGKSPAFAALASTFENPSPRNLSTPPPLAKKVYPKSNGSDSSAPASRSSAIASLSASFEQTLQEKVVPRSVKESPALSEPKSDGNSSSSKVETLTIQEDTKEGEVEDEEGLILYPYERLTTSSTDPASDIDILKRETYLSSAEFRTKFGMPKKAFYKLPKWKQNKMKMALQLF